MNIHTAIKNLLPVIVLACGCNTYDSGKTPEQEVSGTNNKNDYAKESSNHEVLYTHGINIRPNPSGPSRPGQKNEDLSGLGIPGAVESIPRQQTRLISPPNFPEGVIPTERLWALYRVFEFREVIEEAKHYVRSSQLTAYDLASIYTLAGAAAHLLGDRDRTMGFIRAAVRADADAEPDPVYFPFVFCALYARIATERGH